MSKIKIKSTLKCKEYTHNFEGKGVLIDKKIIYNDNGITTKINLDEEIWIERKKDYLIKMGFSPLKKLKGEYTAKEGKMDIETETISIETQKNSIKIIYNLIINSVNISKFELNINYTIDT